MGMRRFLLSPAWMAAFVLFWVLNCPAMGQSQFPYHSRFEPSQGSLFLDGVPVKVVPMVTPDAKGRIVKLAWRDGALHKALRWREYHNGATVTVVDWLVDASGNVAVYIHLREAGRSPRHLVATKTGWRLAVAWSHPAQRVLHPTPTPTLAPPEVRITPEPLSETGPKVSESVPMPRPTRLPQRLVPDPEHAAEGDRPVVAETPHPESGEESVAGVFVSQLGLGGLGWLGFSEQDPGQQWDVKAPFLLGGHLEWNHMFTPYVGLGVSGGGFSYRVDDLNGQVNGAVLEYRRSQYSGRFALLGRLPLGDAIEVMLEPGFALRTVFTESSVRNYAEADLSSPELTRFGASGSTGYGFHLGLGTGLRMTSHLALLMQAEWEQFFSGSMAVRGVPTVFPLMRMGAFGGLRLQLQPVAFDIGIQWQRDASIATDSQYIQSDWGPRLQSVWLY